MGQEQTSTASQDFRVPAKVGKYQLLERIGSGTCGVVYRAYDAILSRDIALKVSPVGTLDQKSGKMPGAQKAFVTETLSAGRLAHPNIVTVYEAGVDGPLNYLAMEYVEGMSLKEYGRGKRQLPPYRVVNIIAKVCEAIDFSHKMGIVHRDIKPANIMVSGTGDVKLLDFGIAISTSASDSLGTGTPSLGTPNYMSPEQVTGKELGPRSDIYSLGAVMFELLTGQQLFKAEKVKELFRAVIKETAPPLRSIRPDLPAELELLLARCLSKNPRKRYASGAEMAAALHAIAEKMAPPDLVPPELESWMPLIPDLRFFVGFSPRDVARFVAVSSLVRFGAGKTALAKHTIDNHVYVILEGVASTRDGSGLSSVLGPGDCFGESGFVRGDKCFADIDVMTDIVALKVASADVNALPEAEQLPHYRMVANSVVQRKVNVNDELMLDLAL
jgi:serine/threonine-protein kinase